MMYHSMYIKEVKIYSLIFYSNMHEFFLKLRLPRFHAPEQIGIFFFITYEVWQLRQINNYQN